MNAADENQIVDLVSKLKKNQIGPLRGYIAMLAVQEAYRGQGIATELVRRAIDAMIAQGAEEVSNSSNRFIGLYALFPAVAKSDVCMNYT